MVPLPSSEELKDAISSNDADVAKKLLEILRYGTDATADGDLTNRTKEACTILVDVWKDSDNLEDELVDALWLLGCTLTSVPASRDGKEETPAAVSEHTKSSAEALVEIIKALVQVPGRQSFYLKLQRNLLPSLLDTAGLASEEELLKRLRIHNTQVNYKQQKYNLLQEDSEGYSKLLHFLVSPVDAGDDEAEQICRLRQLLGTFELDPNRAMDLTVDVLELKLYPNGDDSKEIVTKKPEKSNDVLRLLEILRSLPVEKLPSLLSFKLSAIGGSSKGLLRTIAFLAMEGILDFSVMFKQFSAPIEKEIEEAHKILWMKEKTRILALTRVSLSGSTNEDPKLVELKERLQKFVLPLSASPMIIISLILLQWGEWECIKNLMSVMSWERLCSLLPDRFGFAFCDMIQRQLLPWYQDRVGTLGLSKPWHSSETTAKSDSLRIDDLVASVSEPLLFVLNAGCMAFRPILYCQLCRVLASFLGDDQEAEHSHSGKVYDFFRRFMIPTISLFGANPAISMELWSVLKQLPYATRYRLYQDWKGIGLEREGMGSSPSSGKPLPAVESEINAGKAARYALKRLSKDNIRDMSRQLAKVTHCCPLVVYATILNQIESYDNMVEVMVEAQRFSNPFGLDVLGFCILSRLSGTSGGVNRSRLKADGVNVSQWLQSLEAFSGAFFKRYPFVEFRGILAYLMRKLREGHVMELGILGSLLKVAGGYSFADYSPAAQLSATQLEGRAGSFTLKRETMTFGIVEDMNLRATDIIKRVLQSDGFGVSMLILIAQARSRVIFESSKGSQKAVKLVGNLYDSCQVVFSLLLDFLTTEEVPETENGSGKAIAEYAKRLPALDDLHFNYGLDVESSWMLCRPLLRAAVQNKESKEVTNLMKSFVVTETFRKKYENMLPEDAWSHLSPALIESFYTNSLYDIFCPEEVYDAELGRVSKEIERLERARNGPSGAVQVGAIPPKNETEELVRLNKVMTLLAADKENQKDHVDGVRDEFETKKNNLMNSNVVSQQAAKAVLLHCVYPRSLQSPDDAMYCAHFVWQLHKLETPGFGTLHYIDELISVVSGSLFGLTEAEAANSAILLWQTWTVVNKWRYEEGLFESEVSGKLGSYMEQATSKENSGRTDPQETSHKDFVALYNTWHATLGKALIGCLKSPEYMHTRTGLVVLTRLVDVFPTRPRLGYRLLTALEPLQDEQSDRPDIRASANAYCTMVLRARDDGKWVEEDAAVAEARAEKEKAAAEERKKKLEEQFEELQRDSEKITEEIGPRDGFERRRGDARSLGASRAMGPPVSERARGIPPSRENGEVTGRDVRHASDRRSPPRDPDRRRDRDGDRGGGERGHARGESSAEPSARGGERQSKDRGRREGVDRREGGDRHEGVDRHDGGDRGSRMEDRTGGRWTRGEAPMSPGDGGRDSRAPKRGRAPSPEPGMDERGSTKRARLEPDVNFDSSRRDTGRRGGGPESSRPAGSRRSRR